MRRWAGLLLAAAVAFPVIGAAPATADDGACASSDGVTVIVDATALGGSMSQRCASNSPSSGLEALQRAGFNWSPVSSQPGMVCRINGRPGPSDQSCASTPPATAYWAYYRARRGGDWKYSSVGAASAPIAGGVEGWVFVTGGQRPPGLRPPAELARAQPSATPSKVAVKPSKGSAQPSSSAKATGSASAAATSSANAGASGAPPVPAPAAAAPGVASPLASSGPPDAVPTSADSVDPAEAGAGSALSTVLGLLITAGLVTAAVVMGLRKRRSS